MLWTRGASKAACVLGIQAIVFMIAVFSGCGIKQTHSFAQHVDIGLGPSDLEIYGMAFITPSTVTGKEQDRQALALIFSVKLAAERPDLQAVNLPETLSAINKAGLADSYRQMFADYSDTGIFKKDTLRQVGEVTGARYLAQIKLASFAQDSNRRLSLFGMRLFQTKQANVRVLLQIWDSANGTIVWEGADEVNLASDTVTEKPVAFKVVVEKAASNLIARLPQSEPGHSDGKPDNGAAHDNILGQPQRPVR